MANSDDDLFINDDDQPAAKPQKDTGGFDPFAGVSNGPQDGGPSSQKFSSGSV